MKDSSLQEYKEPRHALCKLADHGKLNKYKERKEVNIFLKLYKSNGADCPYLLALTKAIHTTNPDLYNKLLMIK
tara:strand:- start:2609 stop:2830 length:222 start_codon:yes stop_codon:yes gene_type:complete